MNYCDFFVRTEEGVRQSRAHPASHTQYPEIPQKEWSGQVDSGARGVHFFCIGEVYGRREQIKANMRPAFIVWE